jgi:hypothetical protein
MELWTVTLPLLVLQALGMAMVVSPLSTAVMLATPDADTGLASGINHAVARAAGLIAVAALGAAAGIVFSLTADGALPGIEFGARPETALDPAAEALRVSASNYAFEVVAGVAALLALISAAVAWFTQPAWRAGKKPG